MPTTVFEEAFDRVSWNSRPANYAQIFEKPSNLFLDVENCRKPQKTPLQSWKIYDIARAQLCVCVSAHRTMLEALKLNTINLNQSQWKRNAYVLRKSHSMQPKKIMVLFVMLPAIVYIQIQIC